MNKRFLFLFTVLALLAGPVMADGIEPEVRGLSAGLEFAMPDVNNAEEFPLEITAMLEFDNSFEDLDVWAELRVPMGLVGDAKEGDDPAIGIELEFDVGYNLGIGSASTLSFGLWGEFGIPISPSGGNVTLPLTPWIQFSQEMNFGDIFAKVGIPLEFFNTESEEFEMGLDLTLGWNSKFGLGVELTSHFMFIPDEYDTYGGLTLLLSYETGPIYAELEFGLPNDFDLGIGIGLLFEYNLKQWTLYLKAEFEGIGSDEFGFTPAVGFKYNF